MIDHPSVLLVVLAAIPAGMMAMGWKFGDLLGGKRDKERK